LESRIKTLGETILAIYVDLDGTLAKYESGNPEIGEPITPMLLRVRKWLGLGKTVKIFTARASIPEYVPIVEEWLKKYDLQDCIVTCRKEFDGVEFWDDRAVTVEFNTGKILTSGIKEV
jgi:hypothetical protein